MKYKMSVLSSSETIPHYNVSDRDSNSTDNSQSRQNIHNVNERNNQKSLLYQALFIHDKSAFSGGAKHTTGSKVNNKKSSSGMVSPKRQTMVSQDRRRWTPSQSPSFSSESLTFQPTITRSLSSPSTTFNWYTTSQSMASDNKNIQYTTSGTVPSVSNEVVYQLPVDPSQQRVQEGHQESQDDIKPDPVIPYYDLAQINSPGGVFQVLNNQCFEAAISDEMKSPINDKYVSKMKHSKTPPQGLLQQTVLVNQLRPHPSDKSQHRHHHHSNRKDTKHKKVSDLPETSSSSDFVTPNMPSPLTVCNMDSTKTSTVVTDTKDHKKHRYNQTFSALEQSGLMKTTMKTAELLRRSRSLQQELAKLRRDTTLFVECVLNNPQNKHIKEQLQSKGDRKEDCEAR